MERVLDRVRRHDILAFPFLTFLLGWPFYVTAAVLLVGHPERQVWLVLLQTPGAAATLAAGLIVRYARGGRPEVAEGWHRYGDWRGHRWWWWAGALGLVPAAALAAAGLAGSFGSGMQDLWARLGWASVLVLPPLMAVQLLSSPLLEEYGWRGFWQARLQHRLPALPAALLVGVLWGLHHVPLAIAVGADPVVTVVGALGPSVLAAWLLNSGRGSMVGPMLLHAGLNLSTAVLAPDSWWFPAATFSAAAVIAVVAGYRDLAHRPRVALRPVPRRSGG